MKLPSGCEQTQKGVIVCDVDSEKVRMKYCDWNLGVNSICKGLDKKEYAFSDVLFPVRYDRKTDEQTIGAVNYPAEKRTFFYGKPLYLVGKIGDLGEPGDKSVIINPMRNTIVRKISVEIGSVLIDVCNGEKALRLPKNVDVYYEPWFMDRGSFVFKNPGGNNYPEGEIFKLATEADIMRVE